MTAYKFNKSTFDFVLSHSTQGKITNATLDFTKESRQKKDKHIAPVGIAPLVHFNRLKDFGVVVERSVGSSVYLGANFVFYVKALPKNPLNEMDFVLGAADTKDTNGHQIIIGLGNQALIAKPVIHLHHSFARPVGFWGEYFGTAHLYNKTKHLRPKGFDTALFLAPFIINKNQAIKTGNLSTLQFGRTAIKLNTQFVRPKAINSGFGTPWLSHFIRHLEPKGDDNLRLGRLWISHHTRFIRTNGIGKRERDFATNHHIGGTQTLAPVGLNATQWLTRIIPKKQTVGISKGIAGEFGKATIDNHTHYLSPKGFGNNDDSAAAVRFGKLGIFNKTQTIRQYFIQRSGLTPQILDPLDLTGQSDFGKWTAIVKRNKTIKAFGVNNAKFGYHQIDNKAAPILPTSIVGDIGTPMIAYRVRKIATSSIEMPYFSYWHIIRNVARVLKPASIGTMALGKLSVKSNLQIIKQIFPFENIDIGKPMIADRVRTIDIEWRYSIHPPTISSPNIDNHTRYITSKGFDGTDGYKRKFGRAELIERFNILKTHGREHDKFGAEVIIKNLTPELRIFGHNSNEFGKTQIRTQWRKVYPFGHQMNGVGKPIIKDRKQSIRVGGFNANGFGWHFVKKGIAPPYSIQHIELRVFDRQGKEVDGFGIGVDYYQVARPSISTNVLMPTGFDSQKIGEHLVTANSIIIDSGIFDHTVPKPIIWLRRKFVRPRGIDAYVGHYKIGKPQLSPYTIYAPNSENATAQARTNHPLKSYTPPMNMLIFGRVWISNQHRAIAPYRSGDKQSFGRPIIINKAQVIAPKGLKGGYFGWHILPFVPQTIEQFNKKDAPTMTAFGSHQIGFTNEGQKQIHLKGFDGLYFGRHKIDHFHRNVHPSPFVATKMGQSKWYDTPFMWQGLRIGKRVLGSYGGLDSSIFGATWISNNLREVIATGFDSFVSETDIRHFKGRLVIKRVGKASIQGKEAQGIETVSIHPNSLPTSNIKNKAQHIRPDGNSEQFRKGAW